MVDLLNKQSTEARRTGQFVQYTLGSTEDSPKKYYRAKIHYAPFVHKYKLWQTLNADKSVKKAEKTGNNWNDNSQMKDDLDEAESISKTENNEEEEREAVKLPLIK